MGGDLLLDTNIVISLINEDPVILRSIAGIQSVMVPSIVIGELYYGAFKSGKVQENLSRIKEFASESAVLSCDETTGRHYGYIKNALREKGQPLPENDIWIAALAQQYRLTLVSRDQHFTKIDGLSVISWQ